jgi:hypothetical protein
MTTLSLIRSCSTTSTSTPDDTVPGNALGGDGLDDVRRARAGNPVVRPWLCKSNLNAGSLRALPPKYRKNLNQIKGATRLMAARTLALPTLAPGLLISAKDLLSLTVSWTLQAKRTTIGLRPSSCPAWSRDQCCWLTVDTMQTGSETLFASTAPGRISHRREIGQRKLQPVSLQGPKSDRTVLQQDQAVSPCRDRIRQARGQLPCVRPACVDTAVATR